MSSKIQMDCEVTNSVWKSILENKWKSISNITKIIQRLEQDKIREESILLNYQIYCKDYANQKLYHQQKRKVHLLTLMIQKHNQIRNEQLKGISSVSSLLSTSTC